MNIAKNVDHIKNQIPSYTSIIGVTKYVDTQVAKELYDHGITHLGENRPDVFLKKYHEIENPVTWHFIGTLQTRKVRDVINKIDYLHSLDRLSLADEIQKRTDQKVNCFVQVNVSEETSKHGLKKEDVIDFLKQLANHDKIKIVGLMTMAPDTDDTMVIRRCFSTLRQLQQEIQSLSLEHAPCKELSMGMTNDYQLAIEEGATFVRLGRCLVKGED
ncbi:MAG: YggS family pyridoxal phosphate-dependent enzyme [Defluviitaleaceae bacterium]|nr:YggS family pyridoxal phosphate-dependent enzyme [Defluviitaleaceae bacterium]